MATITRREILRIHRTQNHLMSAVVESEDYDHSSFWAAVFEGREALRALIADVEYTGGSVRLQHDGQLYEVQP